MNESALVRRACEDDAEAIAAVHVRAWHETYTGLLPQTSIDARTFERRLDQTRGWLRDQDTCAHVASIGADVVGFATGGALREPVERFDGELRSIYLLARAQRHGLGAKLVRAIALDLHARGFRSMAVFVFAENTGARAFYERLGARIVQAGKIVDFDETPIEVAIYGWDDLAVVARALSTSRGSEGVD